MCPTPSASVALDAQSFAQHWPLMLLAHFVGDVRLTLLRLLAADNRALAVILALCQRIAAAHRGTLQYVNHVLHSLPRFVASEILGHVV
jgi:hypothetical protein